MTRVLKACVLAWAMSLGCLPAQAQGPLPVRVAEVAPIAPYWPSFIAEQKGMYGKHDVSVTVTRVGSPATSVQQLVGGAFDIASTTFDTALRAAGSGAPVSFVGATAARYAHSVFVDPSIRNAADLRGKVVQLSFQKDLTTTIWNQWLAKQGIKPGEIDQVYDGSTPNRFAALNAKRVQGAMLTQPFDLRAERDGYRRLVDLGAFAPDYVFLGFVARPDWLKANPAAARAFLAAQAEAIGWFYDPANKDEAIAILVQATKQDVQSATATYEYYSNDLKPFSRTLRIPDAALETEVRDLVSLGDLKSAASVPATFVDLAYVPR